MDCKEYYNRTNKEYQDNLMQTVKGYSNAVLNVQIEMQQERIKDNLYCKVATKTKVKKLLVLLLEEQNKRNVCAVV